MTRLWVICGAGRGVGKTRLAQKLCDLLPRAVYAKCGCGRKAPGKPENFFRTENQLASFVERSRDVYDHVVVESNRWALKGQGDVVIFVDGIAGRTRIRRDAKALREVSHIQVGPGGSPRSWKRTLRRTVAGDKLRDAVCAVLSEQKRYLGCGGPAVRSKVWLAVDDVPVFGLGLAGLLEKVDRCGTLSEAARVTRMSYRYAWNMIRKAEKRLGKKLVLPQPGGAGGGKSLLSPQGRSLLNVFNRINEDVTDYARSRFAARLRQEGL